MVRGHDILPATAYLVYIQSVAAGLVTPFSPFLQAFLEHFQVHLLHLRPRSIALLSIFGYFCEAWLRIKPYVSLL
jgi:sterol desaturase/sphingolipid hydroxylase (fatty acid hydroxylase superfamily)